MKKGLRKPWRIGKGPLPSIEMRPEEAERRTRIGHWEDDSIVYSPTIPIRLYTTNERGKRRSILIGKAYDRTMSEEDRITMARFQRLPSQVRKTLTRDRGAENLGYETLEKELGMKIFSAHVYHSWERGRMRM